MIKHAFAVVGRKLKVVKSRKKKVPGQNMWREIMLKEEIVYSGEALNQSTCECSYVEDVYLIFKTKKEAESYIEYSIHNYAKDTLKVKPVRMIIE